MALLLYLPTAALLLWLARRYVAPIPKGVMVALVFLPFVFCGEALLTGGVYAPVDLPYVTEPLRAMREPLGIAAPHNGTMTDLFAQMIPWRKAVQFALRHGQWPLWNPFMLSGDLLAASAQPAVYSPFTLLACLLPIAQGLTYSATLTFFLAALGAYLFARELGCREGVALLAAAGWMYAKPLAFFILWSIGGSWALFPFVLLATRRVVREPSVRSGALLTATLSLLLLAGHPETVLHAIFIGALYGALELARHRREVIRVLLTTLAAGALSVALCAIYILPIFEAAPQTMEHAFRTGGWAAISHGVKAPETGARLLTDFFPWLHGAQWEAAGVMKHLPLDSAAAGSLLLALALYAIVRVRTAETWFFAAIALLGLLARAAWTPVMDALSLIPMFDVTINERFSFPGVLALVILAALGLEHALARADLRALALTMAATLVVLAGGAVAIQRAKLVTDILPNWGVYALFAELACLAAATVIVMARPPLRVMVPLLLVVLLTQRYFEDGDAYPTVPARGAYPPIPIFEAIRRDQGPFRIVAQSYGFVPGTSALYELEDVRGYEALTFARYFETYRLWCLHQPVWFNRVDDLTRPFLNFLNVRYAVSGPGEPPPGWRVVARQRGAQLLENGNVIERAFIPREVRLGLADGDALTEMALETNFRERAWVQAPVPPSTWVNEGGTLRVSRRDTDLKVASDLRAAGWIVISQPAWKGWRVYIDDRRVEWFVANEAFIGVYVPGGKHNVRLVFLPEAFVVGRGISGVALAGVILAWFVRRRLGSRGRAVTE
jgi:hypothetical protein